jgi:hypothetical protein
MGLEHHVDKPADNEETSFSGAVPMIPDSAEKESSLDSDKDPDNSTNKPLQRVGYTIDMSINLGNSSHYDVHDASQGFSIWTEEVRGRGNNWFFVMFNLFGRQPDGSTFSGIAVKLLYGVAFTSWDGRVLKHCTSLSHPDGPPDPKNFNASSRVSSDQQQFANHLYGNFTSAKDCAGGEDKLCWGLVIQKIKYVDGNVEQDVSLNGNAFPTAANAVAPFVELLNVDDYSIPKKQKHYE